MSDRDFPDGFDSAVRLSWQRPPASVSRSARTRPPGEPSPPPPSDAPEESLLPDDVRSGTLLDPTGIVHRSLAGLDVTVMLRPSQGDELSSLQGRVWPQAETGDAIRILLVQNDHVLAEQEIEPGGRFRFAELLVGPWSLEFRWGGRVAVLRGGPA